jgi:hypothetical protein
VLMCVDRHFKIWSENPEATATRCVAPLSGPGIACQLMTRPPHRTSAAMNLRNFAVIADDGTVGGVEIPLVPPGRRDPDYLVVRVRKRLRSRFPVVSAALVTHVESRGRIVRVRGRREQIGRFPEYLPPAF